MDGGFEEKRKDPRIEKELKVDFEFFYVDEVLKYGYGSSTASLDVSLNGIKLTDALDSDISTDKPVEMKIHFPDSGETFEAIGQVKWQRQVEDKLHFGVEIITMAEWEKFSKKI